jgi:hypothetical protein
MLLVLPVQDGAAADGPGPQVRERLPVQQPVSFPWVLRLRQEHHGPFAGHNWLDFPFQSVIEYWMWGRVYSQHYTVSFAYIQCNEKVDRHAVKVLMLANGREVVLSTGNFRFIKEDFAKAATAEYAYPKKVRIEVPDELEVELSAKKVIESQNMLQSFSSPLRFIAMHLMHLRPWYFRLESDFTISALRDKTATKESGTALHEIVMFKSAE